MSAARLNAAQRRLLSAARAARRNAYAPYSKYKVGAAVRGASGKIYSGCNVENASYGLTNCAERTAIFSAIAAGERRIEAVAIMLDAPKRGAPCGACRQVIHEFGRRAEVIMGTVGGACEVRALGELLPLAFGPEDL